MDGDKLKLEIKNWEHSFKKENKRAPTKEDIKQNSEIALKYRQYKAIKLKVSRPEPLLQTPTKRRRANPLHTPQKTSPAVPEPIDSPVHITEIGPTPQLNGRVLSIFDVITSPQVTPVKKEKEQQTDIPEFSTPKKKLDFSFIVEEEKENNKPAQPPLFKTPVKQKPIILETPNYLKIGTTKQVITASPSPLASQRIRKGLSTIINEFHDIQDELKYGDFDEEDLLPLGLDEIEEENEEEEENDKTKDVPKYKKSKTQKRQTRRVKMKAKPMTETDEIANKNLKDEIKKLEQKLEENENQENNSDPSEWSEEEEGSYVSKPLDPNVKRKPAVSRNFKKLKINKRKGGLFGRRSKW